MRDHRDIIILAAVIAALFLIGLVTAPDPHLDALVVATPPGTAAQATTTPPPPTTEPRTAVATAGGGTTPAVRLGNAEQVTDTLPPPPTTTTIPIPDWALCPQWWQTAYDVGWPADELWHVDRIIFGESRCVADVFVDDHDDWGGGLMGINVKAGNGNRSLVGPWVDWDWSRLLDPAVNLRVGLLMADYVETELGWCRWRPWTTRDRSVCG